MSSPNIIVIAVDRLGAGWLGPYGNSWVATPGLNQLAARSALCEFVCAESYQLAAIYRSYWTGSPSWQRADHRQSLPELAAAAGYATRLVTDAADIAALEWSQQFQECRVLDLSVPKRAAREVAATRTAKVFRAAAEALDAAQPLFSWIHASAMQTAWDAPYELRARLADEDDPAPPKFIEPPSLTLPAEHDPDELLGYVHSYAAEVTACDEALQELIQAIDKTCAPDNTLLVVTSPRGFALGEHLQIGASGDALRGEVLQVPLIVRLPQEAGRLTRLLGLFQTSDLFATLTAALGVKTEVVDGVDIAAVVSGQATPRQWAIASAPGQWALRTSPWFFRHASNGEVSTTELYAKPDDRWEVNQVAGRAAEIVAAFEEVMSALIASSAADAFPALPPLPEILLDDRR